MRRISWYETDNRFTSSIRRSSIYQLTDSPKRTSPKWGKSTIALWSVANHAAQFVTMSTNSLIFEIEPAPTLVDRRPRRMRRIMKPADNTSRGFLAYLVANIRTSLPLVIGDVLSVYLGILIGGVVTYFLFGMNLFGHERLILFLPVAVLISLTWLGTYPLAGVNPAFEFRCVSAAIGHAFLLVAGFCFAHYAEGAKIAFAMVFLVGIPTAISASFIRRGVRRLAARFPWWGIPVLFVGDESSLHSIYTRLSVRPWLGYRPVGYVGASSGRRNTGLGRDSLGSIDDIRRVAEKHAAYVAVVDETSVDANTHDSILRVFPDVYSTEPRAQIHSLWLRSQELAGFSCQVVRTRLLMPWHQATKRAADVVFCAIALVALLPMLVAIACAIRISSSGPVLYSQRRIGRHGKYFSAWKFRTMVSNADEVLQQHLDASPELRAEWEHDHKLRNDPRITSIGKLLRKTSLDEIPQLWNVFKGEMSLVGPRPIVDAEVAKYAGDFSWYTQVKPGLTGLWQVSGRNKTTYDERIGFDSYYVVNWSLWLDSYILLRTFKTVLFQIGAY